MRSKWYRKPGILLLAVHVQACTSWQATQMAPRPAIVDQNPEAARVTIPDGSRIVVLQPRVEGDSIVGIRDCESEVTSRACEDTEEALVSLGDVQLLEVRRFNPLKTLVGVAVTVATLGLVILFLACTQDDGGLGSPC